MKNLFVLPCLVLISWNAFGQTTDDSFKAIGIFNAYVEVNNLPKNQTVKLTFDDKGVFQGFDMEVLQSAMDSKTDTCLVKVSIMGKYDGANISISTQSMLPCKETEEFIENFRDNFFEKLKE